MRHLDRFRLRLRSVFRRGQVEACLAEELEFHLDQQIQENLGRGMSPSDARADALRVFGGIAKIQEECRDMRSVNLIETLIADVRYAIRGFHKQPGFALLAILTLALGTGASTALFSLVNAVLLRPLPMADAGRLLMLWEDNGSGRSETPAPANFADWRAQNHTFEDIAAGGWLTFNLTDAGEPERLTGLRVTANYFTVLGVKPAIGRLLAPADDGLESGHVAVISYALWQRRFASDPGIVGRTVNLNGQPYAVVGVAPAGFQFPASGADLWIAPGFTQRDLAQRSAHLLLVTGRLKTGVSFEQARADMQTIAKRLKTQYPQTNAHIGISLVPLREYYTGDIKLALKLLLAAVGALLLIVCANLAHLFLARGVSRRREIAMRAVLGAGRARVVRQLLTECAVLAFIATLFGALLSTLSFRFLVRLIPSTFPTGAKLHFDFIVFGFASGLALFTALLFGVVPAIKASRLDLNAILKGGGKGWARGTFGGVQGGLVATEVALTLLLLIAGGLLVESYVHLRSINAGFHAQNVLIVETALPPGKYAELARRTQFYRQIIEQTARLPGVMKAAYVNFPPLTLDGGTSSFFIEGRPRPAPGEQPRGANRVATADYLQAMGIPLLRGRFLNENDGSEAPPVVVINETMARRDWPGEDPVGARIRFGDGGPKQPAYTIVGVAGDVRQMSLDAPPYPEMYFAATQGGPGGPFFWPHVLVVRTAANPLPLAASIRRIVASVDQDQPVASVRTMTDVLDSQASGRQTQAAIVAMFAISALLLASVGLYGVLSYAVEQRRAEIGIRMALGARRGEVVRSVIAQALRWTTVGSILGVAGAFALTRAFSSLLFNVSASDPRIFVGFALLTLGVTIAASFIPAHRAATVDPLVALRQD